MQLAARVAGRVALQQPHQLHGQGGTAGHDAPVARELPGGAQERARVDSPMRAKAAILHGQQHGEIIGVDLIQADRQSPAPAVHGQGAQQASVAVEHEGRHGGWGVGEVGGDDERIEAEPGAHDQRGDQRAQDAGGTQMSPNLADHVHRGYARHLCSVRGGWSFHRSLGNGSGAGAAWLTTRPDHAGDDPARIGEPGGARSSSPPLARILRG